MKLAKRMILWLAFFFACFPPASALTLAAPENCVWQIFNTGYDAATADVTDLGSRTETSTSNYDTAPIHRADGEHRFALGTCALFGPNTGFKAAEEAPALAGSIRNVNPLNGDMNCVNCALATDSTLAGQPASALLSGPKNIYSAIAPKSSWADVSGQMEIGSILSQGGNGARGIVYGASPTGSVGHVFNAVNQNGTIRFLDGQIGGLGVDNFDNFTNFKFLLTHPGGG